MRRLPKTHKKLPMRKQDEPDFYMLDKTNPLPAIEDAPVPGGLSVSNAMRGGASGVAGGMPGGMPGGMGGGMGGMPGAHGGMGVPPQPVPPTMAGRMLPPPTVSHAPQPRFSQGMYGADPLLQGQDDYGDMPSQGERGMMSRGLMQSSTGAFRSPMHGGQGMPQGMAGAIPGAAAAGRMAQQMGGRGMANPMYPSNQFMNPMQGMQARRFRPMGMEGGMSSEQAFPQDGQDDFYSRQQAPMRRMPMDQMTPMQQMYNDRASGGQDQMPQGGDQQSQGGYGSAMYSSNFRDLQSTGNDYMYRGEGGGPQMGGSSEEYMGMVSPMRRNRPPV